MHSATTTGLCRTCSLRSNCKKACAELLAVLGPAELRSYREVPSQPLIDAWGTRDSAHGSEETVEPTIGPALAAFYGVDIQEALLELSNAQRQIVLELLDDVGDRDSAWQWAERSRDLLRRQALERIRKRLGPPPRRRALEEINTSQRMETIVQTETIQSSRRLITATKRKGTAAPQSAQLIASLVKSVPTGSARIVDVTPALAEALMERNEENRSIAHNRVASLAEDISSGEWQLNNNGIGIGPEGQLWDGQHRLAAVLVTKKTVRMLVVGLEKRARSTIDQGRPRSVGDNLRILDRELHGPRIASWLNVIEALETRRSTPLSHAMTRARLRVFEQGVRYFIEHGPRLRPFYRAAICGAFAFAFRTHSEATSVFARGYVTGADLPESSPALLLRGYVADHARVRTDTPRTVALKALRCLEAFVAGERIERLAPSEDAVAFFRVQA